MAEARRIIVVHTGAGGDVSQRRPEYVSLLQQALRNVQFSNMDTTEEGHLQRFTEISRILEASVLTNTGYGSCVCEDGSVRCDSCVQHLALVDGKIEADAVGCVVCNSSPFPMQDAVAMVGGRRGKVSAYDGVVAPVVRIGKLEKDDTLVSPQMRELYHRLEADATKAQDTVGVFLYESWKEGEAMATQKVRMTVGSSSGGNMLRPWTRVGSAGVVGSGCWIERSDRTGDIVCALASGQGEHIIRHDVARTVSREMLRQMEADRDSFLPIRCAVDVLKQRRMAVNADVGVVGVSITQDPAGVIADLFYVHNTASFVLGSVFDDSGSVCMHVGHSTGVSDHIQQGQWPLS